MSKSTRTAVLALLAILTPACNSDLAGPRADTAELIGGSDAFAEDPTLAADAAPRWEAAHVSVQRYALVPPACFPACPDIASEQARGRDILVRGRGTAINHVYLNENVTPGNVYVYAVTPFNSPEHCEFIEDRFLGVPYPCRANGPLDRLDGLDPRTGFYVATYAGREAKNHQVGFRIDVVHDTPTEVLVGSGVTNVAGMMFYAGVMDKGAALPEEHPLYWAQRNTLKGGCQGPPAFGPLPCRWVHMAAHAPR